MLEKQHFTEQEAALIMRQIFSALAYMHQKNIVHRGIQPSSILYENSSDLLSARIGGFTKAVAIIPDSVQRNDVKFVSD